MNSSASKTERPTSITVICVIGLIGSIFTAIMAFTPVLDYLADIYPWYPAYMGFVGAAGIACMIGFWLMKKWALYTYCGLMVLSLLVMLIIGMFNIVSLIGPAIVIFFAAKHRAKMS